MQRKVARWVKEIRRTLRRGASPEHAKTIQRFFKEPVSSQGWHTADLRKLSARLRRRINDPQALLNVADRLFAGRTMEEKTLAVLLLQKSVNRFGDAELLRFEGWIPRITNWSDHDSLVHYLIGPLVAAKPMRAKRLLRWAKKRGRWYRRAAAVGLIFGARQGMFASEIMQVSNLLLDDEDEMVQKGLGWLLREWGKKSPAKAVSYLFTIRSSAPRLVLRTACEKLSAGERRHILARAKRARTFAGTIRANPRCLVRIEDQQ